MLEVIYLIDLWNKVNKTMLILQLNEKISLIKTWLARVVQKRKHNVYIWSAAQCIPRQKKNF